MGLELLKSQKLATIADIFFPVDIVRQKKMKKNISNKI